MLLIPASFYDSAAFTYEGQTIHARVHLLESEWDLFLGTGRFDLWLVLEFDH